VGFVKLSQGGKSLPSDLRIMFFNLPFWVLIYLSGFLICFFFCFYRGGNLPFWFFNLTFWGFPQGKFPFLGFNLH
jgi:hypothetical protein